MGLLDLEFQPLGEVWDLLLEPGDGLLKVGDLGFSVGVKPVQELGEVGGVAKLELREWLAVLKENGLAGVLEDRVLERIAFVLLASYLGIEAVGRVLGLPVAAGEVVAVEDGAIWAD